MIDSIKPYLDELNLPSICADLNELIKEVVGRFALTHQDKNFFACALDCQIGEGWIAFSFGDVESQIKHNPGRSLDELLAEMSPAWEPGDWKFVAVNDEKSYENTYDEKWGKWQKRIRQMTEEILVNLDYEPLKVFQECILDAFTETLLKAEKAGCFEKLNRSKTFKAFVIEHDESLEEAFIRRERVLKEITNQL